MKMSEFMKLAKAANRAHELADSPCPEKLMGSGTSDEVELYRAAIRRVAVERRNNIIERVGVVIDEQA
jgi:hypothetical protein